MLDALVEEIKQTIVQSITNNRNNYMLVGKLLEEKRPHLHQTPFATHSIDLMIEDFWDLQ